jgi:hypothetical protein
MQLRIFFLVFFLGSFSLVFSQSLKLSGKVVNEKNEAVSGVSVKLNDGTGTSTNIDGQFSLVLSLGKNTS